MEGNSKNIWIGLFVVLVLIAAGTYFISKNNNPAPTDNNDNGLQEEAMVINAKHSFVNGKHIVAGEVEVPTPCTSLEVTHKISSTNPSQVVISFQTVNESEVCVQVIATRRFKVEFNAPEQTQISATWNGKPAILNLTPPAAGENLENFEIFLKG